MASVTIYVSHQYRTWQAYATLQLPCRLLTQTYTLKILHLHNIPEPPQKLHGFGLGWAITASPETTRAPVCEVPVLHLVHLISLLAPFFVFCASQANGSDFIFINVKHLSPALHPFLEKAWGYILPSVTSVQSHWLQWGWTGVSKEKIWPPVVCELHYLCSPLPWLYVTGKYN